MTLTADNPLVEGLERLPIHPTTMVIFGGTGDLSHRKLLPAIYNLAHEGALPERFNLIGVSRSDQAHEAFRAQAQDAIKEFSRREPDPAVLDKLLDEVRYVPGVFDDGSVYETLGKTLDERVLGHLLPLGDGCPGGVARHQPPPAARSMSWPPNWLRSAASTRLVKSPLPREYRRA